MRRQNTDGVLSYGTITELVEKAPSIVLVLEYDLINRLNQDTSTQLIKTVILVLEIFMLVIY